MASKKWKKLLVFLRNLIGNKLIIASLRLLILVLHTIEAYRDLFR